MVDIIYRNVQVAILVAHPMLLRIVIVVIKQIIQIQLIQLINHPGLEFNVKTVIKLLLGLLQHLIMMDNTFQYTLVSIGKRGTIVVIAILMQMIFLSSLA